MNRQTSPAAYRSGLDLSGAFIRRTNMNGFNLENANLSGSDCTAADLRGADFRNADLTGAILKGADLTGARNLTSEQLSAAIIDHTTILPDGSKAFPSAS